MNFLWLRLIYMFFSGPCNPDNTAVNEVPVDWGLKVNAACWPSANRQTNCVRPYRRIERCTRILQRPSSTQRIIPHYVSP